MNKIALLKAWSVWTFPFTTECKQSGIIAYFTYIGGMWREDDKSMVGISNNWMKQLLSSGYAKYV